MEESSRPDSFLIWINNRESVGQFLIRSSVALRRCVPERSDGRRPAPCVKGGVGDAARCRGSASRPRRRRRARRAGGRCSEASARRGPWSVFSPVAEYAPRVGPPTANYWWRAQRSALTLLRIGCAHPSAQSTARARPLLAAHAMRARGAARAAAAAARPAARGCGCTVLLSDVDRSEFKHHGDTHEPVFLIYWHQEVKHQISRARIDLFLGPAESNQLFRRPLIQKNKKNKKK